MPTIYFSFFTRSVERREPEIFIETLRRYFGDMGLPDDFAADDDESFDFKKENMRHFTRLWWDGYVHWHRKTQEMSGKIGLGNWNCHTTITHEFRSTPASEDKCADFLIATSLALNTDYAYAHLLPDNEKTIRPDDRRLPGAVALDLRRALPGVPWASCFGRPYIDLFGSRRLLAMPLSVVRELSDGVILCQLTEHIRDAVERPDVLGAAQTVVFGHLGRNAFYDPDDPDRDDVYNIDRSSGKILAPAWPDPITVPAVTSNKFWAGK